MADDIGSMLGEYTAKLAVILTAVTRRRTRLFQGLGFTGFLLALSLLLGFYFERALGDSSHVHYSFFRSYGDLFGVLYIATLVFLGGIFAVLLVALSGIRSLLERDAGYLADIIERIVRKLRSDRDQLSRENRNETWGVEFRLIEAEAILKRYQRLRRAFEFRM